MKNKKIKIMVLISLLIILLAVLIILLMQRKTSKILQAEQPNAKARVYTKIGVQEYDITNLIETNPVPTISAGMIPIKWNDGYWEITTKDNWCDYSNGQPAYMMLNDGVYQSEEYYQMPDSKQLAKAGTQIVKDSTDLGSIYMWIPRYAYNDDGNIIYIEQTKEIFGTYKIPEIFTYKVKDKEFLLSGVWVEYDSIVETELENKVIQMNTKDSIYGFIANTKTNAMGKDEHIAIQRIADYLSTFAENNFINDETNENRTIIKIINENMVNNISAEVSFDENTEIVKIEVTKFIDGVTKILDSKGNILLENMNIAEQQVKDATPYYIIIDKENMKKVKIAGGYFVYDKETLSNFRDGVNAGSDFTSTKVYQIADIDLNEGKYTINETTKEVTFTSDAEQWIPIGTSSNQFSGIYNGQEYKINGVYINNSSNCQGLFGYIKNSTIKGINLSNGSITTSGEIVGGIAGEIYNTNIMNCSNACNITAKTNAGGIAGYIHDLSNNEIIDCNNTGNIKTTSSILSGICANLGYSDKVKIKNCYNIGNLSGTDYGGGIIGYLQDVTNCQIEESYNIGNIEISNTSGAGILSALVRTTLSITDCYNVGDIITTKENSGGIVGIASSDTTIDIDKCYNTGDVFGYTNTGGIIGGAWKANTSVKRCYNSGYVKGSYANVGGIGGAFSEITGAIIEKSYNIGDVETSINNSGGILGVNFSINTKIIDCYNNGNIKGVGYVSGICGNQERGNVSIIITNCYNAGTITGSNYMDGIIYFSSNNARTITNCYYLNTTRVSSYATSKTSLELQTLSNNLGVDVWQDDEQDEFGNWIYNKGYPILKWQVE